VLTLCDQNWDELFCFLRPDPAVGSNGNQTQMTADAAADFNKEIWHLAGQAEVSGVVITLSFPVSKWRGEVRGASVKLSAFISHGRIQGQKWLRTAGLDVMDEEVCLWVKLPLLWATEIMCDKCIF